MLGISISELPVEENLCLLHAKYFIYGCKYREQKPNFSNFIKYLESKHNVEMYIAKKNTQIGKDGVVLISIFTESELQRL